MAPPAVHTGGGQGRRASLTRGERQLLVKMANGKTIAEAAAEVGIKQQSAKNKLMYAYQRLNADIKTQAFLALGWLTPPEDA